MFGALCMPFSLLDVQSSFLDWKRCMRHTLLGQAHGCAKVSDSSSVVVQEQLHGQSVDIVDVGRCALLQLLGKTLDPFERHAADVNVRRIGISRGCRGLCLRFSEDLCESLQAPG